MELQEIEFTINGNKWKGKVHPMKRLVDTIREDIKLKGTKIGCGEGECGTCTILLNGVPVRSCLIPTCQAHGKEIITIEGIKNKENLHPIQQAFIEEGGVQCGMCIPGMIMSAYSYYENNKIANSWEEVLAGNMCRCTGYNKIVESCRKAEEKKK